MKDNFSTGSDKYAKFRPTYPPAFFNYLYSIVPGRQCAWDCGTGNGQVAIELAKHFEKVYATDISRAQIDNALQADNITYAVTPAEHTQFDPAMFDLVVIAQAIHWFNFDEFYSEVRRTVKKNGLFCVIGYGMITVNPTIDKIIDNFYTNVTGPYWDPERRYVDEGYQTIPFPFEELDAPEFKYKLEWSVEHLIGYFSTWSAVKHFIKANGYNPVDQLKLELAAVWGDVETRKVSFPFLLRIGRV